MSAAAPKPYRWATDPREIKHELERRARLERFMASGKNVRAYRKRREFVPLPEVRR